MSGKPSPEQFTPALLRANTIRSKRAAIKQTIAGLGYLESREECARWIQANDDSLASMTVADLLVVIRRFGRARARVVLAAAGCSEFTTVGDLTDRQRAGVCATLRLDLSRARLTSEAA